MKTMTAQELKKKLDDKEDFILLFVLTKEMYEEKHIPTAINIPFDQLEDRVPKEIPDKDREIVVYCASTECTASSKAGKLIEEMGYTNVTDYEAGTQGWEDAGFEFA